MLFLRMHHVIYIKNNNNNKLIRQADSCELFQVSIHHVNYINMYTD